MFPASLAGIALVILRGCVALQLFVAFPLMAGIPAGIRVGCIAVVVLTLAGGAFTPAGCLGCVLLQASTLEDQSRSAWPLIVPLMLPIVLLLLGPGAYSFDAKRYGRRVISGPRR